MGSPCGYLLKPFDDERFRQTLARVRRSREAAVGADKQAVGRILAESGSRMHILDGAAIELVWVGAGPGDRGFSAM